MNQQQYYSIDIELDICAEFIAEAIEANNEYDPSILSWGLPIDGEVRRIEPTAAPTTGIPSSTES